MTLPTATHLHNTLAFPSFCSMVHFPFSLNETLSVYRYRSHLIGYYYIHVPLSLACYWPPFVSQASLGGAWEQGYTTHLHIVCMKYCTSTCTGIYSSIHQTWSSHHSHFHLLGATSNTTATKVMMKKSLLCVHKSLFNFVIDS